MQKSKKYDVLVVGELNVDIILNQITDFPEIGKEKIAKDLQVVLGSSSAILASNLSILNTKVGFVGKIGKDAFGELTIKTLNQKGVDTSMITYSTSSKTGATVVMSYENDRSNLTYQGAMSELNLQDVKDEYLKEASHLHLSSCFMQPQINENLVSLFKKAKSMGLSTSLDPQWDPAEQWFINQDLFQYVDFFMPNQNELLAITHKNNLKDAFRAIPTANYIIAKMGISGSCLYQNGNEHYFKAYLNDKVVDTIGAGDSFNAGFLSKYMKGSKLEECIDFGSKVAAVSTTASGGTGAFTSYENVLNIIQNKF